MVASSPLYVPPTPCSATIVRTPWKKPLNLRSAGARVSWSWMRRVLIVSMGVTATIASAVPAPRPHSSVLSVVIEPFASCSRFLSVSYAKKRDATLGTENHSSDGRPRYKPVTPAGGARGGRGVRGTRGNDST